MVNHQSNIDIPVLVQSLANFQLRWIAKKELLWVPLFGWAMWATKHITVDRSDRTDGVKSLERAKQRIAAGISVVVFPEGTRSRDGKLSRFKKGGFLLAVQTGKNIVPITINGSGKVLPSGDWRLRPGTIEVIVEKPIMGGEKLLGNGDLLFLPPGTARLFRVHGAFVSDQEVRRVMKFIKQQGRPNYRPEVLEAKRETEAAAAAEDEYDEMYDQAVAIVTETQQASISMIQRRLRVGYNRAARMRCFAMGSRKFSRWKKTFLLSARRRTVMKSPKSSTEQSRTFSCWM